LHPARQSLILVVSGIGPKSLVSFNLPVPSLKHFADSLISRLFLFFSRLLSQRWVLEDSDHHADWVAITRLTVPFLNLSRLSLGSMRVSVMAQQSYRQAVLAKNQNVRQSESVSVVSTAAGNTWLLHHRNLLNWVSYASNYAIKRDLRRNTAFKPSFQGVGPLFWLLEPWKQNMGKSLLSFLVLSAFKKFFYVSVIKASFRFVVEFIALFGLSRGFFIS
jgi:hypothetical protein